jgi:DNA-directed RNA polymerase specialized sigma24 family protein
MTIARNAVRHLHRRRVGEPAHFESVEVMTNMDALAVSAGWGCAADGATSDGVFAREVLTAAVAILPADEREVLILRELDGLSGDETAHVLQVSLAAMKSRLHRARLHLTAVLRATSPMTSWSNSHAG